MRYAQSELRIATRKSATIYPQTGFESRRHISECCRTWQRYIILTPFLQNPPKWSKSEHRSMPPLISDIDAVRLTVAIAVVTKRVEAMSSRYGIFTSVLTWSIFDAYGVSMRPQNKRLIGNSRSVARTALDAHPRTRR